MSEPEARQDDRLARVPKGLREHVQKDIALEKIISWAPYDLSPEGMYIHGYLALAQGRLGHFHKRDGLWQGEWLKTEKVRNAVLVDGLGMGVLRLISDSDVLGEWRFTRRHEKDIAQLHRQLERQITGKEPEPEPAKPLGEGEKKIRCDKCGRVIPSWSEVCPACMSRRKILARLLDFVKPYKWQAAGGMAPPG